MSIKLRTYQREAVDAMMQRRRGICVAPAGSGKTVIAAALADRCARECDAARDLQPRLLWIAHTQEQVAQGYDAVGSIPGMYADVEFACYAGMPDTSTADILIVDECHWVGAPIVKALVDAARPGCRVYGFTATPLREDGVDIESIIGPVLYAIGRADIQAVGGVLPGVVRVVSIGGKDDLDYEVDVRAKTYYTSRLQWCDRKNGTDEQWKRCQYRAAVNIGIRENLQRDAIIASIATRLHADDSVLVLVDSKDHGMRLSKFVPFSQFVCSGNKGRKAAIDAFRAGVVKCLICTSLADEGMDVPVAGVLIMAGAGKAFGKIIQRTGRVLRPHEGKDKGVIYDLHDLGHGMLNAQHWRRRKIYKAAGYRIEAARV